MPCGTPGSEKVLGDCNLPLPAAPLVLAVPRWLADCWFPLPLGLVPLLFLDAVVGLLFRLGSRTRGFCCLWWALLLVLPLAAIRASFLSLALVADPASPS